MANVLIYVGLSILIIGSLFALIAAVKGWQMTQKIQDRDFVRKALTKYTKPSVIITAAGFVLTGIGIVLSLN